jgi:hypothetical protein
MNIIIMRATGATAIFAANLAAIRTSMVSLWTTTSL